MALNAKALREAAGREIDDETRRIEDRLYDRDPYEREDAEAAVWREPRSWKEQMEMYERGELTIG